mmetsp:Transcript_24714/g.46821  ORF Transcript_24714/g.46821 Transcript_24714/m.46821 type:complete len:99 (+) Transcript_24714:231-527(+)|eukprot:CAMPEP_0114232266 /NCGR_PEP_ID=MMETSP0058-20121206/4512_1 /TAXON_ID=36894 /ORGANISM="Pyramimonas parkeae, CCMP726" /LENGTH=98 /DNA_ID=CAMNT_0001343723 /DNA_START=198 /DNA_END=494 /DNA_ORIENTATION=+
MPWSIRDAGLFTLGTMFVVGGVVAFKKKATTPFKIAYFGAWTTLGPATILLLSPDEQKMEQKLRQNGLLDDAQLEASRQMRAQQFEALRSIKASDRVP